MKTLSGFSHGSWKRRSVGNVLFEISRAVIDLSIIVPRLFLNSERTEAT